MTSTQQCEANRTNAKRSTGPRTSEGKAVSRLNAAKHGLTAQTLVLPGEDPASFATLRDDVLADFQPSSAVETHLAEHVASLLWRLRRLATVEYGIFAWEWYSELSERANAEAESCSHNINDALTTLDTFVDEKAEARAQARAREATERRNEDSLMLGCSFRRDASTADAFSKLSRYQACLERSLFRTLAELRNIQSASTSHP